MILTGLKRLAEAPRLQPIEIRTIPSYAVLLGGSLLVCASLLLTDFTYDGTMNPIYLSVIVMVCAAWGLRYLSLPRVAGWIEATALKFLISSVAALSSAIIASSALPLVDEELVRWDAAIGFDWLAMANWLSDKPWLIAALKIIYESLPWQWVLVIPLLFLARHEERCWTFILAWGIALAITLAIFPFFPALGPIVHHQFSFPGIPLKDEFMDVFEGARNGTLRQLGAGTVRGMVTMPSFHAGAALLLGWAYLGLGRIGFPLVALNALMFLSAMPIGGHYAVDIIAGGAIAACSIAGASALISALSASKSEHASRAIGLSEPAGQASV